MWWLVVGLAWQTSLDGAAPARERRYHVASSFCPDVLGDFREDRLLSWRQISCADVRVSVRRAFDAWQHNSRLHFVETEDATAADVVVEAVGGAERDDATTLASAASGADGVRIAVTHDFCWYTDREFCVAVREHSVVLLTLMGLLWCLACVTLGFVVCRPSTTAVDGVARIVAWTVVLSQPLTFWCLLPCLSCYDFETVLMHEVGHALGFVHSDVGAQRCGCANRSVACDATDARAIMHSVFATRARACLERDDVDGVRTLYGGDCDAPVRCYQTLSYAGFTRLTVAVVYSFTLAWTVVFCRNVCAATRRRWHQPTRVKVLVVRPSVVDPPRPSPRPSPRAPPKPSPRAPPKPSPRAPPKPSRAPPRSSLRAPPRPSASFARRGVRG